MTGDDPLGADNDTDAIRIALMRADSILSLLRYRGLVDSERNRFDVAEAQELARAALYTFSRRFPATPAGIVAGSDSSGLPATPKPHH